METFTSWLPSSILPTTQTPPSPSKIHLPVDGFSVVMYGCESWTIKKAEHWRIYAFDLWCWRRLLRVPWKAGRSSQSILKKINPEYPLEGLMLKLKFQSFHYLMWKVNSLEKTLGKIEGGRRSGKQRIRWLDGTTNSMDMSLRQWRTKNPSMLQSMRLQRVRYNSDWTTTTPWLGSGCLWK